jgi:hypothetical protein
MTCWTRVQLLDSGFVLTESQPPWGGARAQVLFRILAKILTNLRFFCIKGGNFALPWGSVQPL